MIAYTFSEFIFCLISCLCQIKGKTNEHAKEIPTSENTITGGNQFSVPLFPRTNSNDIVVSPAIKQVPIFLNRDVAFIFPFVN